MTQLDLRDLVNDWEIHLKAERKAPGTITSYLAGTRRYLDWCDENGLPEQIDRAEVKAWVADILAGGATAYTAINRQVALKLFASWLADEGIIESDPLLGLKRPRPHDVPVEPLTVEEIGRLIEACSIKGLRGNDGAVFRGRRDESLIRVLAETGMRAGEVVSMTVSDTNLRDGVVLIRRAKGGKTRRVPISPRTAEAITRYMRLRKGHRLAAADRLWLGWPGRSFEYPALRKALRARAETAGIEGWHPHRMRHTMADRWLSADGSESGLMAVAGWSNASMLRRYTAARREARAAEEARRLGLGEL